MPQTAKTPAKEPCQVLFCSLIGFDKERSARPGDDEARLTRRVQKYRSHAGYETAINTRRDERKKDRKRKERERDRNDLTARECLNCITMHKLHRVCRGRRREEVRRREITSANQDEERREKWSSQRPRTPR